MTSSLRLVFSNYWYYVMASAISAGMLMLLSALSEYVFFEPYFVFYIPLDKVVGFLLIIAVSVLSGIIVTMNVYVLAVLQKAKRVGGSFVGSLVGVSAGACSCGPVGFAIISTFGTAGGLATAFLTAYEIPLRIASIGILGYVFYSTNKLLNTECKYKGESA
ncbi:MAG TPA: hypothetical protein VNK44_07110 [Candidatus Nitrosotenuis sp.]|nr:hypothetical protein [Candidatus Nitrosotenuis sp.]